MLSSDWDMFTEYVTWFVKPGSRVAIKLSHAPAKAVFAPTKDFQERFPRMTALISASRISQLDIEGVQYLLYTWAVSETARCGWLCEMPSLVANEAFHSDHQLLLRSFGGVRECFNEPPNTWLQNLNWSVCASKCGFLGFKEIADLREFISPEKEGTNCSLVSELDQYVRFALEANGNFTAYRRADSTVVMFAPDHSFKHIIPVDGCPEYSFYRIPGAPTFVDWIEEVAGQWRRYIMN
jgi:hypothetical protein